MNLRIPICRLVWLAALIVCNLSCLQAADRVFPKQGVPVSGKIVEITPAKVTIEVRGKNQVFEVKDLSKLSFDKEPVELDRARQSYLNGQFDQALEEVKKINVREIQDPRIKEDVEFYRYYCEGKLGLAGNGDKNAAIAGLRNIASGNRNTHHMFPLSELLGELALAAGYSDRAGSYFNILLSAPDDDTKARGIYRLAELDRVRDDLASAKKRFGQLVNAPSKSPSMIRLKSLAEVGLAICENQEGNSQEALKRLDALVAKNDSTDQQLFAKIYNAKGACFEKLDQPRRALLSYLKTDLLFFTEAEAHAEALYHLKQLWSAIGESSRAADAGARLVASYASSSWANQQ